MAISPLSGESRASGPAERLVDTNAYSGRLGSRVRALSEEVVQVVTIEVSSQALADDLVDALRSMGCIAVRRGERWVEVRSGWPVREDASPRHFDSYLRAWEAHSNGRAARVG